MWYLSVTVSRQKSSLSNHGYSLSEWPLKDAALKILKDKSEVGWQSLLVIGHSISQKTNDIDTFRELFRCNGFKKANSCFLKLIKRIRKMIIIR